MSSTANTHQPGMAAGLSLVIPVTLSTMAIVLLAPILPLLKAEFADVPNADYLVPIILTLPALCIAVLSPVAGMLGDYFGRRRLLMWSLGVYGIVGLAPIFLTNIYAILISRIGVGITEALIMTLSTTLIADYFTGAKRDKWLAAQTAAASISALLFFNIGGMLGAFGWRAPFWVYTSSFLMLAAIAMFTWEPTDESPKEAHEKHHLHNVSWAGFPWLKMTGIVLVTIFASVLFYTVQVQAAFGLGEHGITDSARIGFLTSIASIGVPLGTFIYSRVGRLPVAWLLCIEFGMLATGFFLMSTSSDATMFLVGCGLNQIGAGMILPTLLVWAVSQLQFEQRARGTGIWQAAFALGQFLSPITVSFIQGQVGGLLPALMYLCYGGVIAAFWAVVSALGRRKSLEAA